jgi:hypothetical protein
LTPHLCAAAIILSDPAIAAANMADVAAKHSSSSLYHGDLFFISELLSKKTAIAVAIVLSISLLWQGYQRRKFYRGLVSKPTLPLPTAKDISSRVLHTAFSWDICHP